MENDVLAAMKATGKPGRPGEIAKRLCVESTAVSQAIKILREKGDVISPKRCYYALA